MSRKLIILLLILCVCRNVFAIDFEVGGINYSGNNNGNATVLGKSSSYKGAIVIPETVSYQGINYTVKTIAEAAFSGNKDITSIEIPPTITFIDEEAFYNCVNLDTVYISSIESWCNIGFDWSDSNPLRYAKHLYIDSKEVTDIVIPEVITIIDEYAFDGFVGIKSITLPKTLEWINKYALRNCENLELVISKCKKLPHMDSDYASPFSGISSKAKLIVPQGTINLYLANTYWSNYFAEIAEDVNESSNIISFSDATVKSICIANWDTNKDGELSKAEAAAVTDIGRIFRKSNIEIFPEFKYFTGLTYIGNEAFEKCSSFTYIIMPPNAKTIYGQAFKECGFTSFSIPEGVESIGSRAFEGCSQLSTIRIPSTVKSIGSLNPFPHSITTITIDADNRTYECPTNSHCILEKETKKLIFGTNTTKIPAGTLSIGADAFRGSSIKAINMPNSVTSINSNAFYGCGSLETLTLSSNLKEIGESAFYGCGSLSEVKLPNTVTTIAGTAFQGCSKITSITIPQNVTTLGGSAFIGCSGLTTANIKCKTDLPYQLFANCTSLSSVVLTDGITSIGNNVFVGCASLAAIEIPSSVKSIGSAAFSGCSALASAIIPNSVTSIGSSAFSGCTALSRVDSKILNPFEISAFSGIPYDSELHVPYGKKSLYENTKGWNVFGEIVEFKPEQYNLNITASGNGSVNYDGRTVRNQSHSFTISESSKVTLSLLPDNGYIIASVTMNSKDIFAQVSDNKLELIISGETNVNVVFEETPPNKYAMQITTTGYGSVVYGDAILRNESKSFFVEEGEGATFSFAPDNDNKIKSILLNGKEIFSDIINNQYSIEHVNADLTLVVEFSPIIKITESGINYTVISEDDHTIKVSGGAYGLLLSVPASISVEGTTWIVTDIEKDALQGNTDLATIIWNPEAQFNGSVSNPNLLLYVKDKRYAPASIKNVIANESADEIVLSDAASCNNFYCSQSFIAKSVIYEHNYCMKSGLNVCQGWETITLPFDVSKIYNKNGEELVPYTNWTIGSSQRPFWLYSLSDDGWKAESSIKANTPYIISMPNNEYYDAIYNQSGEIVFSASNVKVESSENLTGSKSNHKNLVPNYQNQESSNDIYALNVNNLWDKNTESDMAEGSVFIRGLRQVRPFEAYMTIDSGSSATRSISIFDDGNTTEIIDIPTCKNDGEVKVYSLSGALLKEGKYDEVIKSLPKGIYIINNKKVVIK